MSFQKCFRLLPVTRTSCCRLEKSVLLLQASARSVTTDSTEIEGHESLASLDDLPGPGFLGNFIHLKTGFTKMHLTQEKWAQMYGTMYKDTMFGKPFVIISDAELAGKVYRAESKWPFRTFDALQEMITIRKKYNLPPSLVELQGEEWAKLRKIVASKMLPPVKLKYYYEDFSPVANDAVELINQNRNSDGIVEDIKDLIQRWSLESIGTFAFGQRTGLLDEPPDEKAVAIKKNIENMLFLTFKFSRNKWQKYLNPKQYKVLEKCIVGYIEHVDFILNGFMKHVQDCVEKGIPIDKSISKSFMYYLMTEDTMSEKDCASESLNVFFAGLDTTSATLSWLWYHLGQNQEKQEELANEIDATLCGGNIVSAAMVQKMPYLRACIKESARLSPAATSVPRVLEKDLILNDVLLPKGTQVLLCNYNMRKDEKMFPNPEKFEPERWLRDRDEKSDINAFASLPFGYGARSCVGKRIAEAEMQILTCLMLKRFRMNYVGKTQIGEMLPLLTPTEPLRFAFYER